MKKLTGTCAVECCNKPRRRKQWCVAHYKRWWKYGDPLAGAAPRNRGTLEERFWTFVRQSVGCWEWQGTRQNQGYGLITERADGKMVARTTHRVSWELHYGSIPKGLMVLHRCDNRKCVRPDHLYLGTASDNAHDMWATRRGDRDPFLLRHA